ncbi:MAG: hypothetical protein ACOZCO_08640 [Bacteroidota bacterium]
MIITATYIVAGFLLNGCSQAVSETQPVSGKTTEAKIFSDTELTPGEYVQWFKSAENPLRKSETVNELRYILEYRPAELTALQQLQKESVTKAELDSAMKDMEGLVQFRMEIDVPGSGKEFLKHNLKNDTDYEPRVQYFAFEMQKDICALTEKGDTIPCAMYHFERSYGVSPVSVFLLGFSELEINGKLEVIVNEKIFANKTIRFVFDAAEIKNIPQLKTL